MTQESVKAAGWQRSSRRSENALTLARGERSDVRGRRTQCLVPHRIMYPPADVKVQRGRGRVETLLENEER